MEKNCVCRRKVIFGRQLVDPIGEKGTVTFSLKNIQVGHPKNNN